MEAKESIKVILFDSQNEFTVVSVPSLDDSHGRVIETSPKYKYLQDKDVLAVHLNTGKEFPTWRKAQEPYDEKGRRTALSPQALVTLPA